MDQNALESVCRDCGSPLSSHPAETQAARCADCFDGFLRARDAEFLRSYGELGVSSRRVIAETCLRALVMESPPHRKVLAMNIMEQYVQTAADLIGLYHALKERGRQPVMRSFLEHKLDRGAAMSFFREIAALDGDELLHGLGLPGVGEIARRCPSLPANDVADLTKAVEEMLINLRRTANMGESAALALAQMAGESRSGGALTHQSAWLDSVGLRADQVAAIAIDERRRTVNVTAISVDEKRLANVVSAIDAMTRASQNMIYAALTMHQEEERGRRLDRGVQRRRPGGASA